MITENLSTLKIHNLTQEQYERELAAGRIDENALYLTPYEEQVQSDWSQNDETSLDFVKNRTHYTEMVEESVDIAGLEYNIQFEHNDSSAPITEHNLSIPLALGQVWSCTLGSRTSELNVFESDDGTLFLDGNNAGGHFGMASMYHIAANTAYLAPSYGSNFGTSAVLTGVSGTFAVATETVHQLDSKYIKDMYYAETKTLSETRTFTVPFINDLEFAQLLYEHRMDAIYTVRGVNYTHFEDDATTNGVYTWTVINENDVVQAVAINGNQIVFRQNSSITVNYEVEEVHHLDPKYIKDMYYEETVEESFVGMEYAMGTYNDPNHEEIPLAIGQKYEIHYNSGSSGGEEKLEAYLGLDENNNPILATVFDVIENENGELYVGDSVVGTTKTTSTINSTWYNNAAVSNIRLVCVSGSVTKTNIHKLDPKYLPTARAMADVTSAPTADDFNSLLAALREAGYLET